MPDYNPTYENSYALVIGINSYEHPTFAPLGNAEKDATDLAAVLESERYSFQVRRLLGQAATKGAIQRSLSQLRGTEPDARVLVYFSGHGYTVTDNVGETGYLACYDTVPGEDHTALELSEVMRLRRRTPAKHVAFIFDACFSEHALGLTKATTVTAEQVMLRRAFQVISAGAPDQTVSDYRSMTHHLLPLLRDATAMLTLEQIGVALKQRVAAESGGMQIPQHGQITGSEGGDFVFYLPPIEVVELSPEPQAQPPIHVAEQESEGLDRVHEVLPPPFAWCEIPGNPSFSLDTDEGNKGTYAIEPFLMAKYLVTYAQYQVFLDAEDGYYDDRWWEGLAADAGDRAQPSDQAWKIDNHPRENVSWWDAVAFCRWLSDRLGYDIRLPTEWEWQWAAQGNTGWAYPYGPGFDKSKANTKESELWHTTPVDAYPQGASPFGVLDMSGNVYEWCLNESDEPGNTALGGKSSRAVRGGAFVSLDLYARPDRRDSWYPRFYFDPLGFRVCVSLSS